MWAEEAGAEEAGAGGLTVTPSPPPAPLLLVHKSASSPACLLALKTARSR